MSFFDLFRRKPINEAIDQFKEKEIKNQEKRDAERSGEGYDDIAIIGGGGTVQYGSFDLFYNNYINQQFSNEVAKINSYREMAAFPEIAEVIENAVDESTQEDADGDILSFFIDDTELKQNDNVMKVITTEFNELSYLFPWQRIS